MSLPSLILIGGGGHCISCIDAILAGKEYEVAGIIDVEKKIGTRILGIPVIGTDKDLDKFSTVYEYFLVTVGQLKSAETREKIFNQLRKLNCRMPVIVSPYAYVSPFATIGEGTIVLHGAIVNANARIGNNCIINSKSLIEHDARIGDHCHVSTAAVCNGEVQIGNGVFIGSNVVLRQGISIGSKAVVGAGAVVINNISEGDLVIGNPARNKQ